MPTTLSQFQGALAGCAVGDALGAPFEGYWSKDIPGDLLHHFGDFDGYPTGQFTDDTQLTVATVRAIVASRSLSAASIARAIGDLWKDAQVIGPGGACMQAGDTYLRTGDWRTCGAPPGQAGNGTAMRTGVLGLCLPDQPKTLARCVADISRLTHQDRRSVAGGVAVSEFVRSLTQRPEGDPGEHLESAAQVMTEHDEAFAGQVISLKNLVGRTREEVASALAWPEGETPGLQDPIITPYVVPTVLACFWSSLSFPDSWPTAVEEVIRLGGDVDTTGAIVGTIMGARLGVDAIPPALLNTVRQRDELLSLAHRFFQVQPDLAEVAR